MSYNLIKKINEQVMREVPSVFFPFQYGTLGAFLSGLMIPVLGTNAISLLRKNVHFPELNTDTGSLYEIQSYMEHFEDPVLTEVAGKMVRYITDNFYGSLRSFFQGEVWQIDTQLSPVLDGYEEFRDALLLFVFSVPVLPVSSIMQDILINFHIFDPDESYGEMQSIISDYFSETPKCQRSYLAWKYLDSLDEKKCEKAIQSIENRVPFTCDGCGRNIKDLNSPFISRVEVYPSRNLKFDYEDDQESKDFEKEISSILETAGQKLERETTKEMWTEYRLFLCKRCRNTFIKRIENGEFI